MRTAQMKRKKFDKKYQEFFSDMEDNARDPMQVMVETVKQQKSMRDRMKSAGKAEAELRTALKDMGANEAEIEEAVEDFYLQLEGED